MENDYKIFNTEPFYILLIEPGKTSHLDWNNPDYVQALVSSPNIKTFQVSPDNFFTKIYELLNVKDSSLKHLNTLMIGEELNYNYEMIYIDTLNKTSELEINEMATMFNLTDEVIKGNAILIKNYMDVFSHTMHMTDMTTSQLHKMIRRRGYTDIVIWEDDNWRQEEIFGETVKFADQFFEGERYNKIEIAFLKHNINIWYEKSQYGEKDVCGKLCKDPIMKCFIFTMITDEIRGSITLDEVKKIIKLSTVLVSTNELVYKVDEKWNEEEKDEHGRVIIKNKYRILENEYQKYFNLG